MNVLALHNNMMTSLEIAEVTGKQHKNVLKAIRKAWRISLADINCEWLKTEIGLLRECE